MLLSDKSNLIPDIRKDSLVENKKYSINNLLVNNQSTNSRTFLVKAYLITIPKDPPCSRFVISCKASQGPRIIIGDNPTIKHVNGKKIDHITIFFNRDIKKYNFKEGMQYLFKVSVKNNSKTDIPENTFKFISIQD